MSLFSKRSPDGPMASLSDHELEAINFWMFQEFEKRTQRAAWNILHKRIGMGYETVPNSVSQQARFWLNAYPALCAIIVGKSSLSDPAFAVFCADQAVQVIDWTNDSQTSAASKLRWLLDGDPKAG
jgi:hypothetical protein